MERNTGSNWATPCAKVSRRCLRLILTDSSEISLASPLGEAEGAGEAVLQNAKSWSIEANRGPTVRRMAWTRSFVLRWAGALLPRKL